ncbi:MAG: hypothetical protein U1C97_01245 [Candidatus Gracilibacteria bacterium]|nr:hypothetical protein [bacterium]MDZ4216927.1 hypothetical protein [Candidatus Gracilibacteria bacterium]
MPFQSEESPDSRKEGKEGKEGKGGKGKHKRLSYTDLARKVRNDPAVFYLDGVISREPHDLISNTRKAIADCQEIISLENPFKKGECTRVEFFFRNLIRNCLEKGGFEENVQGYDGAIGAALDILNLEFRNAKELNDHDVEKIEERANSKDPFCIRTRYQILEDRYEREKCETFMRRQVSDDTRREEDIYRIPSAELLDPIFFAALDNSVGGDKKEAIYYYLLLLDPEMIDRTRVCVDFQGKELRILIRSLMTEYINYAYALSLQKKPGKGEHIDKDFLKLMLRNAVSSIIGRAYRKSNLKKSKVDLQPLIESIQMTLESNRRCPPAKVKYKAILQGQSDWSLSPKFLSNIAHNIKNQRDPILYSLLKLAHGGIISLEEYIS